MTAYEEILGKKKKKKKKREVKIVGSSWNSRFV